MKDILVVVENRGLGDAARAFATQLARAECAAIHSLDTAEMHESVVDAIARERPDVVVLATRHRPSVTGLFIHDLADRIIGAELAPVLLVDAAGSSAALERQFILVPLDGSDLSKAALPLALELARALNAAGLILFQAVGPLIMPYAAPPELEQAMAFNLESTWDPSPSLQAAREYLEGVAMRLRQDADVPRIETDVRLGNLAETIGEAVANTGGPGIGLIVMMSRGRIGFGRWLLGSSLADVVDAVDLPVVAVPPMGHARLTQAGHVA
jgi:nucleotide-binding universal stress UspA family protein